MADKKYTIQQYRGDDPVTGEKLFDNMYPETTSGQIIEDNDISKHVFNRIEKVKANGVELAIDQTDKSVNVTFEQDTYEVVKEQTAETGYIATYHIDKITSGGTRTQAGVKINIPKDYLVKNAELKTCTVADVPVQGYVVGDKYIDFTVNTVEGSGNETHIYLLVTDLIDVYTAGNGIDIVNNEISVDGDDLSLSANGSNAGVAVTLGGTVANPTITVVVTGGSVASGNTSVVTGGAVYTAIENAFSGAVQAGTYSVVQTNSKGIVTAAGNLIEIEETANTGPSNKLVEGGIFFKLKS